MLEQVKLELADNYTETSDDMLQSIIERVTADALSISNSETKLLESEIINCVKVIYMQRGSEDVKSLSQGGINSTYKDAIEEMRINIISNGKRRLY